MPELHNECRLEQDNSFPFSAIEAIISYVREAVNLRVLPAVQADTMCEWR